MTKGLLSIDQYKKYEGLQLKSELYLESISYLI